MVDGASRGRWARLWLVWALTLIVVGCEVHLGPLEGAPSASGGPAPSGSSPAASGEVSGEVWIYSSIYQNVIDELTVLLAQKHPGLKVQWYRAGSEVVARRLDAELRAGGTQADLVMTSDPFWYDKLKADGMLMPYVTPSVLPIDRSLMDLDGAWVTCRLSTMIIAYHPDAIAESELPATFEALAEPRFTGKVTLGDPLSSGTNFTALAFLVERYGWGYFETLRKQGAVANGGNSAVLRRVEGKEFPLGVVLLENVLAAQAGGSPIKYVLPSDGAITIPGPVAILSSTDNPAGARAVYDVMMSPEGQRLMVVGNMHSANPAQAAPPGAPSLDAVLGSPFRWTPEFRGRVESQSEALKSRYDEIFNR